MKFILTNKYITDEYSELAFSLISENCKILNAIVIGVSRRIDVESMYEGQIFNLDQIEMMARYESIDPVLILRGCYNENRLPKSNY